MSNTASVEITNNSSNTNDLNYTNGIDEIKYSRQFFNLVILNLKRYLYTRYMTTLLILGGFPILIGVVMVIKQTTGAPMAVSSVYSVFQNIFRVFYIHFVIFFIASIFGFSLLRKEIEDQTLHYLFLQPVSKSSIIFAKFSAYLIISWVYLSVTFLIFYSLLIIPNGFSVLLRELFVRKFIITLIKEIFVMLIALLAYGCIAMVMGSIFKTGIYGGFLYLWETLVPYLPSTLKSFTISHYLQALTPEKSAIPPKMFELYGEFPSLLQCYITLFFLLAFLIGATIFIIRQYECKYS